MDYVDNYDFNEFVVPMSSGKSKKKKDSKKSQLWDLFRGASNTKIMPWPSSSKNIYTCQRSGRRLLCNAQVYVFAEQFNIKPLKELALKKVHRILIKFQNIQDLDIVGLLSYVYDNTTELVNSEEQLRALVVHYAACVLEDLMFNKKFQSLLVNKGELGRDLMSKLISRLD